MSIIDPGLSEGLFVYVRLAVLFWVTYFNVSPLQLEVQHVVRFQEVFNSRPVTCCWLARCSQASCQWLGLPVAILAGNLLLSFEPYRSFK